MDHNLEASLAMEGIENMDFEHSGVEVAQETMGLEASVQTDANSMDMDSIEEQPVLMDGGSEEVIISDFIGDQFGFQEYCVQTENTSGANITIDANQLGELNVQNQQNVDMQPYSIQTKPSTSQPGLITIKAIPQQRAGSKRPATIAPYPRQVAIAPKPTKGAPNVQYAIAPKPVYVMNKNNPTSKPVAVQSFKGNTVLAQIGKQLVMVPASHAGQKLKVASIIPGAASDGNNIQLVRSTAIDSAQLIANKAGKQMKTKFIIQGQSSTDPSNQPAVITKLMPVTSAVPTQARYIMQQKTVPISIGGNKVLITSPSKQTAAKGALKKQIISIKAENPKVATSQANMQTKKILITANPAPSQIKTAAAKTATQAQGQRTQLHPINVPGKGIQYIKLVTNQSAVAPKPALKPQTLSVAGKNFVLTDSKGNLIQMNADKVLSGTQPPPLIVSTNAPSGGKVAVNTRKLVRIAPITTKSDTSVTRVFNSKESKGRVSQSLLVPRETTTLSSTSVSLEQYNEMVEQNNMNMMVCNEDVHEETVLEEQAEEMEEEEVQDDVDVKPTLASLISDAVAGEEAHDMPHVQEVEIEFENTPSKREYYPEDENTNSMDEESRTQRDENLLLVPTNSSSHNREDEHSYQEDTDTSMAENSRVQAEVDIVPYPTSPEIDQTMTDSMIHFEGLSRTMRPRKACNCTKSQCLKLYCDCFANGEFCNQCNCNNCYNNLEHEDTRQKAIRACLERNPNAFRPKIGKAKVGGPEIVRRHNKGCNCKRSGCLKNYCECYEAKIACTLMCKCVGCRNIEETLERRRDAIRIRDKLADPAYRPPLPLGQVKQPCNFMTREVIEAVAQCMLASVAEQAGEQDPVEDILLEMSRCMADIITASHHAL